MLCGCLPQQRFGTWGRLGQEEPAPREGGNGERFLGPPGDAGVRGLVGFILPFVLSNKERKLCAHPRLEIYQQDQIYFMCPLARQGDFYVPEVKETERKSRGPAEANDALVDGTGTGSGVRVGSHPEPPSWTCGPGEGASSLAVWHCRCPDLGLAEVEEGTHLPMCRVACPYSQGSVEAWLHTRYPGNADRDPAPDSLHLQMQQANPWKLRSQTAGCSWRGGGHF